DNVFAELALGKFARGESVRGFGQRVRHALQVFRGVNVADEAFGRLDLVGDSVQPRSQRCGESEIRVAIGARDSAFDAQRLVVADHAKARGAVIVTPRQSSRRPRAVNVAFI